jgi:hypothetical protein
VGGLGMTVWCNDVTGNAPSNGLLSQSDFENAKSNLTNVKGLEFDDEKYLSDSGASGETRRFQV